MKTQSSVEEMFRKAQMHFCFKKIVFLKDKWRIIWSKSDFPLLFVKFITVDLNLVSLLREKPSKIWSSPVVRQKNRSRFNFQHLFAKSSTEDSSFNCWQWNLPLKKCLEKIFDSCWWTQNSAIMVNSSRLGN